MPICQDYSTLSNPEIFNATSNDGSITIIAGGAKGHRPDFSANFRPKPEPYFVEAEETWILNWDSTLQTLHGLHGHFEVWMNDTQVEVPIERTMTFGEPSSYTFTLSGIDAYIFIV